MRTLFIFFALIFPSAAVAVEKARYPNEIDGYRFYASAKWKQLVPLESSMADIRRVLGDPPEAKDIADYFAEYPGDDKAVQPVWTYDLGSDWEALVYFVKSGRLERARFDRSLYDRLHSVDYISKRPLHFDLSKLSPLFKKSHTRAADAAWDEYSDGSGLVYEVYTTKTPYGGHVPGDLSRIVYGPPEDTIRRLAKQAGGNNTPKSPSSRN